MLVHHFYYKVFATSITQALHIFTKALLRAGLSFRRIFDEYVRNKTGWGMQLKTVNHFNQNSSKFT